MSFLYSVFNVPFSCDFRRSHGGDERNRTADPLLARQVLSQLSYTPISQDYVSSHSPFTSLKVGGLKWTRTIDLTLIRRVL